MCSSDLEHLASLAPNGAAAVVVPEGTRPGPSDTVPNGARIIEIPSGVFLDSDGPLPEANSGLCGSQILLTSGTTGTYKRLELDSAAEDRRNAERARLWRFDATTVNHGVDLGLWTAIGFKQPAAVWHAGGTVVFDQGPEPFTRFFRHGVNRVYFLSSMLAKLLEAQRGAPAPANVEIAIGAGFLPLPLAQRADRKSTRLNSSH